MCLKFRAVLTLKRMKNQQEYIGIYIEMEVNKVNVAKENRLVAGFYLA